MKTAVDPVDAKVYVTPGRLNAAGQCCGRKPVVYKVPVLNYFCARCNAKYDRGGLQAPNWAFGEHWDGNLVTLFPTKRRADTAWALSG